MNLFVLPVDDTTSTVSSAYIVENGIHHGKYSEGERWTVNTDKYYSFPGALYIVGVYGNGNCLTRPIYVNLPLYDCLDFVFVSVQMSSAISSLSMLPWWILMTR